MVACNWCIRHQALEVRTSRGDGNNLYQYALIWTGNQLNAVLKRLRPRQRSRPTERNDESAPSAARSLPSGPPSERSERLDMWLRVLTRAQPITNALARRTRPLIEPLERRGWGDELLVYARRLPQK